MKGFKDFLMRGNVVDLAVAVIIGAAFGAIVKEFADKILGGLIAAIVGKPDFNSLELKVGDTAINYGTTLTAAINFLIVAAVIYFLIVLPMNKIAERRKKGLEESDAPSDEAVLLGEIRDLLRSQQGIR